MTTNYFDARLQKEIKDRLAHQASLEQKHGLTGHPKADKLYQLAWDFGHSSGYHEIEYYYDDFAELLKPL